MLCITHAAHLDAAAGFLEAVYGLQVHLLGTALRPSLCRGMAGDVAPRQQCTTLPSLPAPPSHCAPLARLRRCWAK